MRISRLDLLRYGHFTDTVLELPKHEPDLHILFGSNEAGKSTALSALEDLFFGIPHNSALNFLHDYGSMRVGAVVQCGTAELEVVRRKGNKDTLLTAAGVPIPAGEGALNPYLAGADRPFFERMFSLNHLRLREGGREILEAKNDVGQALFSAGAGLTGLRERLKALDQAADQLWAVRRAGHRRYYQADDRLKAADSAVREHTVTAAKWQDLKRTFEAAQRAYDLLSEEIEAKAAEQKKLARIRRVYKSVRRMAELDAETSELGEVTLLPEDAGEKLQAAIIEERDAKTRREETASRLEPARQELDALVFDEQILRRCEDILRLHERRIQIRAEREDLPKREAELASAEAELRRLALDLGWETGDIDKLVQQIPPRPSVAGARALLTQRGERMSGAEAAEKASADAEAELADLRLQLEKLGTVPDIETLGAALTVGREAGDVHAKIDSAENDAAESEAAIERGLGTLRPKVAGEAELLAMYVPPKEVVQAHRDSVRDLGKSLKMCRDRIREAESALAADRKRYQRIARDEHAVPAEDLARGRQHRDSGWLLVRIRFIEQASVADEDVEAYAGNGSLADAYETAVAEADDVADRRFDKAEAAARLATTAAQIADREADLERLQSDENTLCADEIALKSAWEEIWAESPFAPLPPDEMLEWIARRAEVLGLVEKRNAAKSQVSALQSQESEAKAAVLQELGRLGEDTGFLGAQSLRVIIETAGGVLHRHELNAEKGRALQERIGKATTDADNKRARAIRARQAWSDWETRWADALSALGIDAASGPEAVAVQLEAISAMRETSVKVDQLRHERIGKIKRDIDAFAQDVAELAGVVAPDIVRSEPDEATLQLEKRLDEAGRTQEIRQRKEAEVTALEQRIGEIEESLRKAREVIRQYQDAAGAGNLDELRESIRRSDRKRLIDAEMSDLRLSLSREGDGMPLEELRLECDGVDLDRLAAREAAIGNELNDMRESLLAARDSQSAARNALEAIGGDNRAATAAADRQAALAEMEEVAEQYVRVRSAAVLLRWAIDRYRREKQAPLLKRAGGLFETLTRKSFSGLGLAYDDRDQAVLTGLRLDGSEVGVGGMSTGTIDQLYLALRVASIEEYLERAAALPFVADDLFVNFDDERAMAGFEVLSGLAHKTQVLFFTHHRHLVDLARKTLGESVSVISLTTDER